LQTDARRNLKTDRLQGKRAHRELRLTKPDGIEAAQLDSFVHAADCTTRTFENRFEVVADANRCI
jgi:hypothetical protein